MYVLHHVIEVVFNMRPVTLFVVANLGVASHLPS